MSPTPSIPSTPSHTLKEETGSGASAHDSSPSLIVAAGDEEAQIDASEKKIPGETVTHDPNIIDWDGPDDPGNPRNWKGMKRWWSIILVSLICFVTPLASSMFAPGIPAVMAEFKNTNVQLASFVVSVYLLGFAFGPLFLTPCSEIYGRIPIYHICNTGFVIFTAACAAAKTLPSLIAFRFFAGFFGSVPATMGGGTITDLIPQEKRGASMAIIALGPLLGPIIGPVAGGYLSQAKGWRWVFWVLTIASGAMTLLAFLVMRETYPVVLLERKAAKLRKETGNQDLRSVFDNRLSPSVLFEHSIIRPMKLLIFSPIVLSLSLFMGVCLGYLYLLFTTFPTVFEGVYHFSTGSTGLTYLGLGVGNLIGLVVFAGASDKILKRKAQQAADANHELKPEYRLPPMIPAAILTPVGLFWYGWTADKHTHWIVPIIGTSFIGAGNLAVFMCIQTYLVDAFGIYSASALAANTVIRSLMGALLPLAGRKMYAVMGLSWGNSLLAFIAMAFLPIPWLLYHYGEMMRKRWPVKL